jgi:hypothetical protein
MITETAKKIASDFMEFIYKEATAQSNFDVEKEKTIESILNQISDNRIPFFPRRNIGEVQVGDDLGKQTIYFDTSYMPVGTSFNSKLIYMSLKNEKDETSTLAWNWFNGGVQLTIYYQINAAPAQYFAIATWNVYELDKFTFPKDCGKVVSISNNLSQGMVDYNRLGYF